MKGLLIGGGQGTRIAPLSKVKSKHLIPVYDKPMVYYPLTVLMQLGFREIILSLHQEDYNFYQSYLSDGSQWGIQIDYLIQQREKGVGYTLINASKLIGDQGVCFILGDNFFYGEHLIQTLSERIKNNNGITCFCTEVDQPQSFGVVTFADQKPVKIIEKPEVPESNFAVTGFYIFDKNVLSTAETIKPDLTQLEVTDILQYYLGKNQLAVEVLGEDTFWADMGTVDSLLKTANFVQAKQRTLQKHIGCPSQTAWQLGLIDDEQLHTIAMQYKQSQYGQMLLGLLRSNRHNRCHISSSDNRSCN